MSRDGYESIILGIFVKRHRKEFFHNEAMILLRPRPGGARRSVHLIQRSIAQSALADRAMRLEG